MDEMKKAKAVHSGGILLYRVKSGSIEVMLVHPGGPFWAKKDDGAWSIPKGLLDEHEDPLAAALREFREETGFAVESALIELGELKQPGGKIVHAWAAEGDLDTAGIRSNTFMLEWPPNSGYLREFPEIDRGQWFAIDIAGRKILPGQAAFLDRLTAMLKETSPQAGNGKSAAQSPPEE
ncbi:MAG: RNA pyrophosphohydrolase [Syntrophaceae bacterium PtaU1.Bin231]|jgi:predicted NUDIX family NTP pyrophosphohydrolase|nr:MAG: RNA pyrophosphohydrolase [Syntrophaceae bacterium PtaU1.Bin231]